MEFLLNVVSKLASKCMARKGVTWGGSKFVPMLIGGIASAAAISSNTTVNAQTVQLPEFRQFSVSTVVEVPDSGTGFLGGIGRANSSVSTRGPGWNGSRSAGSFGLYSNSTITATIIDLDELDRAIRMGTPDPHRQVTPARRLGIMAGSDHPAMNYRDPKELPGAWQQALAGDPSMAQQPQQPRDIPNDVMFFLEQADRARGQGRYASAEVYYKMALEKLPAETLRQIEKELAVSSKAKIKAAEQQREANLGIISSSVKGSQPKAVGGNTTRRMKY